MGRFCLKKESQFEGIRCAPLAQVMSFKSDSERESTRRQRVKLSVKTLRLVIFTGSFETLKYCYGLQYLSRTAYGV